VRVNYPGGKNVDNAGIGMCLKGQADVPCEDLDPGAFADVQVVSGHRNAPAMHANSCQMIAVIMCRNVAFEYGCGVIISSQWQVEAGHQVGGCSLRDYTALFKQDHVILEPGHFSGVVRDIK
jgi:hypothetical protein